VIFAVAEKHSKGAVIEVGNDKVWVMIVIEVGDSDRSRTVAGGKYDAIESGGARHGGGDFRWVRERGECNPRQ
jgi:hypothetical protein